jgi:hypothetical protein
MISTGVLLVYLHVIGRKGNDGQGTLLEISGIIVMPWDPKKIQLFGMSSMSQQWLAQASGVF